MTLSSGFRLGPYEIVSPLGAGGMGEVYRAHDARLGRDVAVKALPASSAGDPERIARFEREAQILAGLNHPHIAALYGLEESASSQFLIMELVEGGTLAERLKSGPIAVRDALTIARQVADALQAAHDRGIIHRDLKPANVAFTADGHAKVLDFGLAKAFAATADAPTVATGATQSGVVLGTAAYMSPEQARGLPLDKRTDIFAFGCVLYEMLTGRNPFSAESVSDIIVAILGREPDWTLLPPVTPARVHWLLRRCLEKDPRRRLHDIADARIELDEALTQPGDSGPLPPSTLPAAVARGRTRERAAWLIALLSIASLVGLLVLRGRDTSPNEASARSYRSSIMLPDSLRITAPEPAARFALSPDGRRLAIVAADGPGPPMLWLRSLDALNAQPLAGTEGALYPFWSPDSRFVAFTAKPVADNVGASPGKLKKIDVSTGQVSTLAEASLNATGAWGGDNVILFTPSGNSPLCRVSPSGGPVTTVTTLDAANGDVQHSYPSFLPDGRHFFYSVIGSQTGGANDTRGVYLGTLDAKEEPRLLLKRTSNARYANGHVIFLRDSTLFAQAFDPDRQELRGEETPLAEGVQVTGSGGGGVAGAVSVSDAGVLAYQTGILVRSQLAWVDRAGRPLGLVGEQADYGDVALSPDGTRAAVSVTNPQAATRDLWIFDLARGIREPFTSDPADDFAPVWSPGGDRLAFSSVRKGGVDLYQKATAGGAEEPLNAGGLSLGKFAAHWSPDGRSILFIAGGRVISRSDLMYLAVDGTRKPETFLGSSFVETQARFSPDGRWVAYASNESGRFEVSVRPFPGPGEKRQVSISGGNWPRWRRDGAELFFVAPDRILTSASVIVKDREFRIGEVRPLFPVRFRPTSRLDAYPYDVTGDGQRFLLNTFVEEAASAAITLVVNWPAALKK